MRYLLTSLMFILFGCSSLQKMALRSATPLFVEGTDKVTLENDWDFFRESAPGNLKFTEMMYLQDPNNLKLLSVVIKSYAAYAYAVPETLAFGDELAGMESSAHRQQAMKLYTRAFDYGVSYLQKRGLRAHELLSLDEGELSKRLSRDLDRDDLTAVLFTAQAWGSLINLQKENIALVSQVPRVKLLFDWVCGKAPTIEHSVCDIFYAQYESSRPKMLGGNPEKGRELYDSAIKAHPRHLLIRLGLIQYQILPAMDGDAYEKQASVLREEFAKFEALNRENLEDQSEFKGSEKLNLYNAIAKKRFDFIEQHKKKIF